MSFSFRSKLAKYPLIWHKQSNVPSSPDATIRNLLLIKRKSYITLIQKARGLSRLPAGISLIKIFLAGNMFPLCGLFVYLSQPGFSCIFPFPSPDSTKISENPLMYLFLDRVFPDIPLSKPGILPISLNLFLARSFPGFPFLSPELFQIFVLSPAWNLPPKFTREHLWGNFIPQHRKGTPAEQGTVFQDGERKILSRKCQKFPPSAMGFSRIRKERFQRNPGNLLPFLTVQNILFFHRSTRDNGLHKFLSI